MVMLGLILDTQKTMFQSIIKLVLANLDFGQIQILLNHQFLENIIQNKRAWKSKREEIKMSGLAPLGVLFLTAGIIALAFYYYESLEKKDTKTA